MSKPACAHSLAISMKSVSKRYRDTTAVQDLSLQVPRGEVLGLIGPNGAGKSTTLKLLMGLLRPSAGTVRVLGMDPIAQRLPVQRRVGYVPEAHYIYRWMRVSEAIGFSRAFFDPWNEQRCADLLELFDLNPRQKVKHLSKGMLGKLALLLAACHEPDLLVLDEPMAGLDPIAREEVLEGVLQTVTDQGQTVIFSSHTMDDVQRLVDSVALIYRGRLLVHQSLDHLLATTKRVRATLVDGQVPHTQPANVVCQQVRGRDWELTVRDFSNETLSLISSQPGVEHVEVSSIGLEDLFKDFVRGQRATP